MESKVNVMPFFTAEMPTDMTHRNATYGSCNKNIPMLSVLVWSQIPNNTMQVITQKIISPNQERIKYPLSFESIED